MSEQERSWRDRLTDVLMMRSDAPTDPRIPAPEGSPPGTPMPDPWRLDQSARARRAFAQDIYDDPRMEGWRGQEDKFQAGIRATPWFSEFQAKHGEEPDLNTPIYDYRSAWAAGSRPDVRDPGDQMLHWSSQFKGANHPNRYVNGIDTLTGRRR
jgi:hypothetical protein